MFSRCAHFATAMRTVGWLAAVALTMGSASCPTKEMALNVDQKFSVNLVCPAALWPRLDRLKPAEIEAYQKHGKPDYFRILYSPHGEIATSREAGPVIRAKKLADLPRSWVYEAKKIEVQFVSPAKFVEVPLSDQLKILCLRGDPQERDHQSKNDMVREMWTYFDVGEKYFFLDGRLVEKQVFTGVGRPFSR
jgi:hypothetical protein